MLNYATIQRLVPELKENLFFQSALDSSRIYYYVCFSLSQLAYFCLANLVFASVATAV
jgi:hypothetical protein